MTIVSPSILSADFMQLGEDIKKCEDAGLEWLHVDVMDGNFVDPISFGSVIVQSIRPRTKLFLDTHLMVDHPLKQVPFFAKAGSDLLNIHVECLDDVKETLLAIKAHGMKTGITLKPNTPVEAIFPYLNLVDLILVMTVEPGYGGQGFLSDCADKIPLIKAELDKINHTAYIEVDGGINAQTAKICTDKGANVLVSGSYLFGAKDFGAAVKTLLV